MRSQTEVKERKQVGTGNQPDVSAHAAPLLLDALLERSLNPTCVGVAVLGVVHLGRSTCHAISGRGD